MDTNVAIKQILQLLSNGDINSALAAIQVPEVDANHRDVTHDLQTLLMRICYLNLSVTNLERVLAAIFEKDPDVNIQDSWGRTALMHACIANRPGYIENLLEYRETDITIADFDGNTALSYAAQNCDIYTMEDILNHQDGKSLVNKHNAKGQTPLTIARKSGDKSIISLFESYVNQSVCLQDKKKHRKPRNKNTVRLPLAYSPSPERRTNHMTNTSLKRPIVSHSLPNSPDRTMESFLSTGHAKSKVDLKLNIGERTLYSKSDSAPTVRRDISVENEAGPSLALTSARLARHHYQTDSLRYQPSSVQSPHALPGIEKSNDNDWSSIPENHLRKQRRPSLSLPDLRISGFLVQSGGSTPGSEDGDNKSDKYCDKESDDDYHSDKQDNVFAMSYPNMKIPRSSRTSKQSDKQFTLPEIGKRASHTSSKQLVVDNISPLARSRKFSNSDDQLNRTVVLQGSL